MDRFQQISYVKFCLQEIGIFQLNTLYTTTHSTYLTNIKDCFTQDFNYGGSHKYNDNLKMDPHFHNHA